MEVCKECHERDRRVTKCTSPVEEHVKWSRGFVGKCSVCGKPVIATYFCPGYRFMMRRLSKEKTHVRM